MKTLVIDRSKWLTGEWQSILASKLLSNGMMCCLGFFCKRLKLKDSEIEDIARPHQIKGLIPQPHRKWLTDLGNSIQAEPLVERMMSFNDDPTLSRKDRERDIKNLFAQQGITVKFTGRYPTKAQVRARFRQP